jgi:quinol monooxygenase YgiN
MSDESGSRNRTPAPIGAISATDGGMAVATAAGAMVLASVILRVRPDKRPEVLAVIDDIVERMRETPTCRRSRLVVDSEDPNLFTLASEWQLAEDAEAFFESREFQTLKSIRLLFREAPVILLDEVQTRTTRLIGDR